MSSGNTQLEYLRCLSALRPSSEWSSCGGHRGGGGSSCGVRHAIGRLGIFRCIFKRSCCGGRVAGIITWGSSCGGQPVGIVLWE